jgi:nucleotidyltransferase substrate binding protein (TIGR01987 family)
VLQEAYSGRLIDDEDTWLAMLYDRNRTSHTYDEALANEVYGRIKANFPVLRSAYEALRTGPGGNAGRPPQG